MPATDWYHRDRLISTRDTYIQIVQFGHHAARSSSVIPFLVTNHISPSIRDAEAVSPLDNSPPLIQTNNPPHMQLPSPLVPSTGSRGANSALVFCTMRDWHTPCVMAHSPSSPSFHFLCAKKAADPPFPF
ncbi:hypothetical protein N7535_004255 [Penicillium sp. DV-2018c]|nr:hypothetical protein N7461_000040 [Penicillium sp. DV-2018c]KAJ5577329.1 hypothetical protein N7535_004255 [Penicillium sp. DV-2018c]